MVRLPAFTSRFPVTRHPVLVKSVCVRRASALRQSRGVISQTTMSATHISAELAAEVDRRLMGSCGYALEQLMELAGVAVATAVMDVVSTTKAPSAPGGGHRVAVVCGPGNNGGDGLVCARHLSLLGIGDVSVVCPINRFSALTAQLDAFRIPVCEEIPKGSSLIVDALFGFSFKPPVREPFPKIIRDINGEFASSTLVSVDVPSGWDVDKGNIHSEGAIRMPDALISLTAPKLCSRNLPQSVKHYVGGRFVPPALSAELRFRLPTYKGLSPIVEISNDCSTSSM